MAHSASAPAAQDPQGRYRALLAAGTLQPDSAQGAVAAQLQALHEGLAAYRKPRVLRRPKLPPRGLYIWGNVGRGKSMLMDLFYETAPVENKRRIHFHRFMQEVHARLHEIRQTLHGQPGDPVALLAEQLADELRLLCFDELQAADVADASLLHRLFDGLFARGVVVVSTSNHPPATLYTGGIQRERFAKFIALLEEKMDITALTSPRDYRMEQIRSLTRTYFSPLGRDAELFVEEVRQRLAPDAPPQRVTLSVKGHSFTLTQYGEGLFQASFQELCGAALGAGDYLLLAERAEELILTGIPLLSPEKRNEAKRFVTLIDALYEARVRLIATAEAEPAALYPTGDGSFEFQRTVSRLAEMQGERYLQG